MGRGDHGEDIGPTHGEMQEALGKGAMDALEKFMQENKLTFTHFDGNPQEDPQDG